MQTLIGSNRIGGQLVSQELKGACTHLGLEGRSVHNRGPSELWAYACNGKCSTCESSCCLPRFPSVVDILGGGRGAIQRGRSLAILILLSMPV